MARQNIASSSAFKQVQQQARQLLITLRKEIRSKESELKRLQEEENRLSLLTGKSAAPAAARGSDETSSSGRINWRAILSQLPKQFKASDIRSVRGLKDKRPSEIFAAITRWIEAGAVKRKARGQYERVG
jgi:SMC interacting uncharacterized protein involved in chromosome segregation